MDKSTKITTLAAAVLLLTFVIYIGYQVTANLTEQIQTVDALEVTVEDKVSTHGWFIRQQTLVAGSSENTAEYLISDGEKVSAGEKLAIFFSDDATRQLYRQCSGLKDRLEALNYAYSVITSGTDSLKMDNLIFDSMTKLAETLEGGSAAKVRGDYAGLQQLVVSRGSTAEDKAAYESQIKELKAQITQLEKQYGGGSRGITAADSGYFVSGTDGFEAQLSPDQLDSLTAEMLENMTSQPEPDAIGSITTGFRWYFAVALDSSQIERLQAADAVSLRFPEISGALVQVRIDRINPEKDGRAVVILRSDVISSDYLDAREQDVDIVLGTHTGLKIPTAALRQSDGAWGVYVLNGSVVKFKPVTWSYQTEHYYLAVCAKTPKEGLYRYDRIIVKGKGLANNKVVK